MVIDANILIRAVLGERVPYLLRKYGGAIPFAAPAVAYADAASHLPSIVKHVRQAKAVYKFS